MMKYFFCGISIVSATILCTIAYADLNQKLITAINDNNVELVQQLINDGADVNTCTKPFNRTALMAACGGISSHLLPKDMPCCVHEDGTHTSWWPAYVQLIDQQHAIIRLLIEAGVDLNVQDEQGMSVLHIACIMNALDPKKVLILIEAGIKLDIQTKDGRTALMETVIDGEREIISFLLKGGANKDLQDTWGCTALDYACKYYGYGDIVELLQSQN